MSGWGPARRHDVSRVLASAFLAGEWDEASMLKRARRSLGKRRWLEALVQHAVSVYRERPADRPRELGAVLQVLLADLEERRLLGRSPKIRVRPVFEPAMGRMRWPVPEIVCVAELAAFLDLHPGELAWLADRRRLERSAASGRLRNYRYTWRPRPAGSARVIEEPKPLLKAAQRRVLHTVLDRVPAHEAAHGFRPGHSAITHARRHVESGVLLRFDLEDFFACVAAGRVYGIFRETGYPEPVAHTLTALTTNVMPVREWARVPRPADPRFQAGHHRLGRRLATAHLPQGAPTSPALANLACHRLDCRLSALAQACGGVYSRYADDIVISGGDWLIPHSAEVAEMVRLAVRDEGFRLNARKSKLMTRAGAQRVCGLVVNERTNVARRDYDRLKAILHDAARNGPAAANRRAVPDFRGHLLGRIAWMEAANPRRGEALRRRFAAIDWGK